jgi:two-component system response regulator HydG
MEVRMGSSETRRILVVDDRPEMAEMIADDLCDRGYEGIAVTSGREALRMLRAQHFDVLVTDLRMPEMDGLALLRAALELDPTRPVILLTAHGTVETAVEATGRGAYHYLTKPFRLETLFRLIEQALGRS